MKNKTYDAYSYSINIMMKLCIGILILSVLSFLWSPIGRMYWIGLFLFVVICFRVVFRSIYNSNEHFHGKVDEMRKWIASLFKKRENSNEKADSKIFSCPECGQKLRVPKGRGKIEITCASCQIKFIRRT